MLHSGGRVIDDIKEIKIDKDLILDIDATVIEAHKNTAKYTQLPSNKKLKWLRADSATYQAKIFNYCDDNDIKFTISGRLDTNVKYTIDKIDINQWERLNDCEQVTEFIHTMNGTNNAFRMIVVKKDISPMLPTLEDCLYDEQKLKYAKELHYCIATNDDTLSTKEIIKLHRQRGETSENRNRGKLMTKCHKANFVSKELKNGFNMSYLPSSDFISNALYFQVGTLAYNLFILFKTILDKNLQKHTVKTIRYKLYNIAGKVINHARKTILKVNDEFIDLLQRIRNKAYQVSLE